MRTCTSVLFLSLFFGLVDRALAQEKGESDLQKIREKFSTAQQWQTRAATIREGILRGAELSPLPERAPLQPRVHSLRKHDGYSVQNVALETIPGFFATGNLYRPAHPGRSIPIILCPHGHAKDGRYQNHHQLRCATLARMGAMVFSYSMVGYNDSTQLEHKVPHALTLQLWNSIRILDFMLAQEGADPRRVAITGSSGGGTQTFLLTAVDDRVTLSIPVVMVASDFYGGCICESGLPIHRGPEYATNNAEIAALAAPRPMLLISVGGDWTKHTPKREFPFIQSIYALVGKADLVENVHIPEGKHDYGPAKRQAAYRFLIKHFQLEPGKLRKADGTIDESEVVIETPEALAAFNEQHPRPAHAHTDEKAILGALRKSKGNEGR